MPRANRYFLPGHVWHITIKYRSQFQSFQTFNRCALFKPLRTEAIAEDNSHGGWKYVGQVLQSDTASQPEIGRMMGDLDYTAVSRERKRLREKIKTEG